MPNISPAQVAEGARLLAECKRRSPSKQGGFYSMEEMNAAIAHWKEATDDFELWAYDNTDALLAAAQRVADVEGCVREILQATKRGISQEAKIGEYAVAYGWQCARNEVRDVAARHNIDLSEPTKGIA